MKKLMVPLILLLLAVVLVLGAAWLYEQRWGIKGPFREGHGHHH